MPKAKKDLSGKYSGSWKRLNTTSKLSVGMLLFVLLTLPLAILLVLRPIEYSFSQATSSIPIMINAGNYKSNHTSYQAIGGPFIARAVVLSQSSYQGGVQTLAQIKEFNEDVELWIGFRYLSDIKSLLTTSEINKLKSLGVTTITYNPEGQSDETAQLIGNDTMSNPAVEFAKFTQSNGFNSNLVPIRLNLDKIPSNAMQYMYQEGLDGIGLQEQQFIEAHCISERVAAVTNTVSKHKNAAGRSIDVLVQIMSSRCANGDSQMAGCGDGNAQYKYHQCDLFVEKIYNQINIISIWSTQNNESDFIKVLREGSLPDPTSIPTNLPTPDSTLKPSIAPTVGPTYQPGPTHRPTSPPKVATPKPISKPGDNNPVIRTRRLWGARVGKRYAARVYAYDRDGGDNLEMVINDLPPGLYQKRCTFYNNLFGRSYVLCSIAGVPTQAGKYQVMIRVDDGTGRYVEKTIPLVVRGTITMFMN
jgi:hypothetical protein